MARKEVPLGSVLHQTFSFISDLYKSGLNKEAIRSRSRTLFASSSDWVSSKLGIESYSPSSVKSSYAHLRLEHYQRMREIAEEGISKWAEELADALAEDERENNE